MTDLTLTLVAFIALLGMIRKNTFRTFPAPSRWLAIGLVTIVATRALRWLTLMYLSRTVTTETFATTAIAFSVGVGIATAIALGFMIAAVFVSREPNGTANTAQG